MALVRSAEVFFPDLPGVMDFFFMVLPYSVYAARGRMWNCWSAVGLPFLHFAAGFWWSAL